MCPVKKVFNCEEEEEEEEGNTVYFCQITEFKKCTRLFVVAYLYQSLLCFLNPRHKWLFVGPALNVP